jgi:flagellar biosynthesis protein
MSDPSNKADHEQSRDSAKTDGLRGFPALSNVAVALRHDRKAGTLPRIVASGRGSVAEQILAIARAEGIEVRQDADLAEVLSALEVGSDIPVEAFAAVAEILSYLYRANQYHSTTRAQAPGAAEPPGHEAASPSTGPKDRRA